MLILVSFIRLSVLFFYMTSFINTISEILQVLPNPISSPDIRSSFDPSVPNCSHSRPWVTEPAGPGVELIFQHVANCNSTNGFKGKKTKNNYYVFILILLVHNWHAINWRFCPMWSWAIITPYSSLIIKIWFFMLLSSFFSPNFYSFFHLVNVYILAQNARWGDVAFVVLRLDGEILLCAIV